MASGHKKLDISFNNANVEIVRTYGEPVAVHIQELATDGNDYRQNSAILRLSTPEVEELIAGLQFLLKG